MEVQDGCNACVDACMYSKIDLNVCVSGVGCRSISGVLKIFPSGLKSDPFEDEGRDLCDRAKNDDEPDPENHIEANSDAKRCQKRSNGCQSPKTKAPVRLNHIAYFEPIRLSSVCEESGIVGRSGRISDHVHGCESSEEDRDSCVDGVPNERRSVHPEHQLLDAHHSIHGTLFYLINVNYLLLRRFVVLYG